MSVSVEAAGTGRAAGTPGRIRWFVVAISVAVGIVAGALLSLAIGLGGSARTHGSTPAIVQVQPPEQAPLTGVSGIAGQSGSQISGPGWSSDCRAASGQIRC